MKKILISLLVLLVLVFLVVPLAFSTTNFNNWGGVDRVRLLGRELPYDFLHVGFNRGGASTASSTAADISSSYTVMAKVVPNTTQACVLDDGVQGQVFTMYCSVLVGSGSSVVTPATTSGFATFTLDAAGESITLYYVDDTTGWIVIGTYGATVNQ